MTSNMNCTRAGTRGITSNRSHNDKEDTSTIFYPPMMSGARALKLTRGPIVSSHAKVFNMDRLHGLGKIEPENPRVEIQLPVQRPLDVFGLAKSVLFALERNISDRQALGLDCGIHHLCLVGGYDLVLQALEQDD